MQEKTIVIGWIGITMIRVPCMSYRAKTNVPNFDALSMIGPINKLLAVGSGANFVNPSVLFVKQHSVS